MLDGISTTFLIILIVVAAGLLVIKIISQSPAKAPGNAITSLSESSETQNEIVVTKQANLLRNGKRLNRDNSSLLERERKR